MSSSDDEINLTPNTLMEKSANEVVQQMSMKILCNGEAANKSPMPSVGTAAASGGDKPNKNAQNAEFRNGGVSSLVESCAILSSLILCIISFPVAVFYCFKVVNEYERAVIFRLGRLRAGGARGPGTFFVLPCIDTYMKVDMRTISFEVEPQEVLTKDSVSVTVDAVVYFRMREPMKAMVRVQDFSASTRLLAASTLRNVLGTKNLAEMLSDRESITHMMRSYLEEATGPWGVEVERVEMQDISLPESLQRALAAEAEAGREAKAKLIAAEGEVQASRALKEASMVMVNDPMAMQLRYLQSMNACANKDSTIIFPVPLEYSETFRGGPGTNNRGTGTYF